MTTPKNPHLVRDESSTPPPQPDPRQLQFEGLGPKQCAHVVPDPFNGSELRCVLEVGHPGPHGDAAFARLLLATLRGGR